jgi:hypothetical protein
MYEGQTKLLGRAPVSQSDRVLHCQARRKPTRSDPSEPASRIKLVSRSAALLLEHEAGRPMAASRTSSETAKVLPPCETQASGGESWRHWPRPAVVGGMHRCAVWVGLEVPFTGYVALWQV